MKKKLTSVLSVVLVAAMLLGFGAAIGRSQRTQPHNPIAPTESTLKSVVWDSNGSLGTDEENGNRQDQKSDSPDAPDEPEKADEQKEEATLLT